MPRYHMNTRPDDAPSPGECKREDVWDAYKRSGQFTTDALDWAGDHAARHAELVALIEDYYAESPECNAALEDIADGARDIA